MSLTKKLDYTSVKPVSVPAKSMRVFLQPYNKSELMTWFNTNNMRSCPSCRSNWEDMIIYINVE